MQAIILAGGKGTRLKPYTNFFPKPLVPIGDTPILEILIRQLEQQGIKNIVILTGHLAELIEAYFGDGKRFGVSIRYVRELTPLNTAGALKLVDNLEDDFLVINGDILTTISFSAVLKEHKTNRAMATIAITKRESKIDFGVIVPNNKNELEKYIEKPTQTYLVSIGVNVLNKLAIGVIKNGESLGMPELLLRLKASGEIVHTSEFGGYWLDIGRVDDYALAQHDFGQNKTRFLK